jgi:hypothetical protein
MAEVYCLAERARDNLIQVASHKHLDLRRALGHARLLDVLVAELSFLEFEWDDGTAHDGEALVIGSERDDYDLGESGDSDLDSEDSDSDSVWDEDISNHDEVAAIVGSEWDHSVLEDFSDSDSDLDSEDSDPDSDLETATNSDSDSESESDPDPSSELALSEDSRREFTEDCYGRSCGLSTAHPGIGQLELAGGQDKIESSRGSLLRLRKFARRLMHQM